MMIDRPFNDRPMPTTAFNSTSNSCGATFSYCSGGGDKVAPTLKRKTPDTDDLDAVLAKDLAQLSMQQRERVLEDIHGVLPVKNEDPQFVHDCLVQVEHELSQMKHKEYYSKALFLAPSRVKDDAFRLMFLRATDFDPIRAAKMIVTHFEHKVQLFGEEKLVKKLTLDDLDDDDKAALRTGSHLFLLGKDTVGRAVCFMCQKFCDVKTWKNQLRSHWYQVMTALEDEEVQKKGVVFIAYEVGRRLGQAKHFNDIIKSRSIAEDGLPFRVVSMHLCYNSLTLRTAISLIHQVSGSEFRVRFRHHFGSNQECQYELMTYGLPKSMLYVDDMGMLRKDLVQKFVEMRTTREKHAVHSNAFTSTESIEVATINDVLLGRGKPFQTHAGNLNLAKIIEEHQARFESADRLHKTKLSWDIVKHIQKDLGGKFLEKDGVTGAWREVSQDVAREKVAYGFRSLVKMQRLGGNGTAGACSNKRQKVS